MAQNKTNKTVAFLLISLVVFSYACNGKKNEGSKSQNIEYRVVDSASGDMDGKEIWATKDGIFQNTGVEVSDVVWIIDQRDYDGDGFEEAYIGQSSGGSYIFPPVIVYYDKKTNTFQMVEFKNFDVVLNDSVEEWNGKWTFTGGNDSHYMRFIYEKGRILKVEDYTKPEPDGAEELLVIDPNTTFTQEEQEASYERKVMKQVSYDLNGDGKNEIIECTDQPGINWGDPEVDYKPMLEIFIKWSNGGATQLDSDEDHWLNFKILSTKTNGVYDLASGIRGVTYRWNGSRYLK